MSAPRAGKIERRRSSRRTPLLDEALSSVRLRTGWEMAVVNVSDTGALLEGSARLLPGTHVNAHVVTHNGRELVRSRVVRAFVCDIQRDAVRYRAAVAFDRPLGTSGRGYSVPDAVADPPRSPGTHYPMAAAADDRAGEEGLCLHDVTRTARVVAPTLEAASSASED